MYRRFSSAYDHSVKKRVPASDIFEYLLQTEVPFVFKNKVGVVAVGASEIAAAKKKDRGDMPGPVDKGDRKVTPDRHIPSHLPTAVLTLSRSSALLPAFHEEVLVK